MSRIALLVACLFAVGCSLEDGEAPSLSAPSEFGLSVTLSASPDQLPRDGVSQSVVTVTVRDASGRPVPGQRLSVSTSSGTLSDTTVTTGSNGQATFTYTAPAGGGSSSAVVRVIPIGTDGSAAAVRQVTIRLGTFNISAPTASFTFSPTAPVQGEPVVFDGSGSTDDGGRCLDSCTYTWNLGGEATRTGRVVTYAFQSARTYPVTLTVTDPAGAASTTTQNVAVARGTLPTASFTFSPTSPGQFETVNFNAAASVAAAGRSIVSYQWDFGDGSTATGVTASHAYSAIGSGGDAAARSQTYTVTLTVTDSAGLKSATSQEVTVVSGVSAVFNVSNPLDGTLLVAFNAEASRGSSNGFGGRNTISNYIWHFGVPSEGTTLVETTNPIVTKLYPSAGTYTVTLTVVDSSGRRETTTSSVTVVN